MEETLEKCLTDEHREESSPQADKAENIRQKAIDDAKKAEAKRKKLKQLEAKKIEEARLQKEKEEMLKQIKLKKLS